MDLDRRQFLAGAATVAGAAAIGVAGGATPAVARTGDVDAGGPFGLGVASGDPLPDSVILWTRLVRDPLDPDSLPRRPLPVQWEIARDASFRHPVRRGTALARPELGHSVHVDVRGLDPAREYAYRFRFRGHLSPTARTRTAPAAFADPRRLRVGIVNCQDFQNGYWPAYLGLAEEEDLDLVLHLGDYIYEYDPHSRFADRNHTTPDTPGLDQLLTLSDYRNRHAQYKLDPALQAAHRAFPWVLTGTTTRWRTTTPTWWTRSPTPGRGGRSRRGSRSSGRTRTRRTTSTCRSARRTTWARRTSGSTAGCGSGGWRSSPCSTPGSTAPTSRAG